MPSNYAHLTFAKKVLPTLDTGLQHRIAPETDEFLLGSFGPDMLFYYYPIFVSRIAKIGGDIHDRPAAEALERLRPLVRRQLPYAASYAAGFICHFVLDNACHPSVIPECKAAGVSHIGFETEFDRMLMEKDGRDPLSYKPLDELHIDERLFCTLKGLYPCTAHELSLCCKHMKTVSGMLTACSGTPMAGIVGAFGGISGTVMRKHPLPSCKKGCEELEGILERSVPVASFLIDSYFLSVRANSPLDNFFSGTFSADPKSKK